MAEVDDVSVSLMMFSSQWTMMLAWIFLFLTILHFMNMNCRRLLRLIVHFRVPIFLLPRPLHDPRRTVYHRRLRRITRPQVTVRDRLSLGTAYPISPPYILPNYIPDLPLRLKLLRLFRLFRYPLLTLPHFPRGPTTNGKLRRQQPRHPPPLHSHLTLSIPSAVKTLDLLSYGHIMITTTTRMRINPPTTVTLLVLSAQISMDPKTPRILWILIWIYLKNIFHISPCARSETKLAVIVPSTSSRNEQCARFASSFTRCMDVTLTDLSSASSIAREPILRIRRA